MESVLLNDQYVMNTRRSHVDHRRQAALYSSMSSLSQMRTMSMDPNHQTNIASYASQFHTPMLMRPSHSSHPPPFTFQPPNSVTQPPLLPLPNYSFKSNPKPSSATNKKANNHPKNGARKKSLIKPFLSSKSPPPPSPPTVTKSFSQGTEVIPKEKFIQKASSSSSEELDGDDESIYTLSPPPSSLPLPSLALMRHRVAKVSVSCTAELVGGANGDGAIKNGSWCTTRDDLMRLLRL